MSSFDAYAVLFLGSPTPLGPPRMLDCLVVPGLVIDSLFALLAIIFRLSSAAIGCAVSGLTEAVPPTVYLSRLEL